MRQPSSPRRALRACVASPEAPEALGKAAHAQAAPPPLPDLPRVPQNIHDISNGNILGFGADLAEDHPGFHDAEYKRRRQRISEMAKSHRMCVDRPQSVIHLSFKVCLKYSARFVG
jgi:Biopterin-dependent aromatic amino acid hydroxylase